MSVEKKLSKRCATDSQPIVEQLRHHNPYPAGESPIEFHETHISWVFVTERHAYKLKKPVCFDFLDFSTADLRRHACQEEVRLNRRLAPDVYLTVLPIAEDGDGRLRIGGDGQAIDWVVQMRRLPLQLTLDCRIRTGQLQQAEVDRLAACLTDFYQQASPLMIRGESYRNHLARHVSDNLRILLDRKHTLSQDLVQRVHQAQLRFIKLAASLLDDRVCDGRIVDGHGDLKPEHVCLENPPVVFDCLEFNAELRQVDVVDELAFLAMECEYLGAEQVGQRVLDHYSRISGDRPSQRLVAFYKAYRACVRAKVCALRAAQEPDPASCAAERSSAREYLWLADRRSREFATPLLIVVGGLMGTGKSTLARALAAALDTELLQTDVLRQELLGPSRQPAEFGDGHYRPDQRDRVYTEMFRRAGEMLTTGTSIVLDGSFLNDAWLAEAQRLARRRGADFLAIRCTCPPEVARQRIRQREATGGDASEGRVDLYEQQRAVDGRSGFELSSCEVDTTVDVAAQVDRLLSILKDLILPADTVGTSSPR